MAIGIIIKGKNRPEPKKGQRGNSGIGPWSKEARRQYSKVSQENKEEFRTEKRVQELSRQGFNEAAISGMCQLPESSVKTMINNRKKENIHLDGKY